MFTAFFVLTSSRVLRNPEDSQNGRFPLALFLMTKSLKCFGSEKIGVALGLHGSHGAMHFPAAPICPLLAKVLILLEAGIFPRAPLFSSSLKQSAVHII